MKSQISRRLLLLTVSILLVGSGSLSAQWGEMLPAAERFEVLTTACTPQPDRPCPEATVAWGVLDKETGLVWEKIPSGEVSDWYNAVANCYKKIGAGRMGWRLPTVEELTSLIDASKGKGLALPDGHPFEKVPETTFWSATTVATSASQGKNAWKVSLGRSGSPDPAGFEVRSGAKFESSAFWCVRGGHGFDGAIIPSQ
jgi:hypothetical protein